MPNVIACPDLTCRAPARIVDRWTWESTSGPVEHVQTRCERGHWFTPTVDLLARDRRPRRLSRRRSPFWPTITGQPHGVMPVLHLCRLAACEVTPFGRPCSNCGTYGVVRAAKRAIARRLAADPL